MNLLRSRKTFYQSLDQIIREESQRWEPPKKLNLNDWAEEYFVLSPESSAQPGRWVSIPYQIEVMNCFTDPRVKMISVMKSARIGFTKIVNAAIGFHMHHDPTSIFVVQPTIEDAKGYSVEEIEPMIRDCPALQNIVLKNVVEMDTKKHDSRKTILHKTFPGGLISMVGANSGTGFRRISRRIILLDEIDAYPASAGKEGDPITLAKNRGQYFRDRKVMMGSTPLLKGSSRIEEKFLEGDQRRYHVPCPQCGHMDFLVFSERPDGRGHAMKWPEGKPEEAYFVCPQNGCVIEHSSKRDMVAKGKWVADKPFDGHASFHLWAAYSYSPNATWADIAREFLDANRRGPEALKVFINTTLGESWKERGEAPDWERLHQRRSLFSIGSVPTGVKVLTCGIDVQKDRWVYEVVGWGMDKRSWSIDAGVISGDTANQEDWVQVTELLTRQYRNAEGQQFTISMAGIDSGFNTQHVYSYVRGQPPRKVMACKGVATQTKMVGTPGAQDVLISGKRLARGVKLWPIGVSKIKEEFYGFLRLSPGKDGAPEGFCFFPEYDEEFFKQLTAEQLVTLKHPRTGNPIYEWQKIPGRENHFLDARVYARAAAHRAGVDRLVTPREAKAPTTSQPAVKPAVVRAPQPQVTQPAVPQVERKRKVNSGFLGDRAKNWLAR